MDRRTKACVNALDHPERMPRQFEVPVSFNRDPPYVCPNLFALGDHCAHQVARCETVHTAWAFGVATWEPIFVYVDHLTRLAALGRNEPGANRSQVQCWRS